MSEELIPATEPAPKPVSKLFENGQDSQIFNVSLRGWLAIIITGTLCGLTLRQLPIDETFKTISNGRAGTDWLQTELMPMAAVVGFRTHQLPLRTCAGVC